MAHHQPPAQSWPLDPQHTAARAGVPSPLLHRPILACDLIGFGGTPGPFLHLHLRSCLYRLVQDAYEAAGLHWSTCYHEDRGDGILFIPPADVPAEPLLGLFTVLLRAGIRRHNQAANLAAQIRLRMAAHAGYLHMDAHGAVGYPLIHLYRLLDAPAFKTLLDLARSDFGLIVSDQLYTDVIQGGPGLVDPAVYQPIHITHKETTTPAWVHFTSPPPQDPDPR